MRATARVWNPCVRIVPLEWPVLSPSCRRSQGSHEWAGHACAALIIECRLIQFSAVRRRDSQYTEGMNFKREARHLGHNRL